MHEECSIRNVNDFDSVDIVERSDDLFVMRLARRIDGYVADQEISSSTDDVDSLDVSAGAADRGRDLAKLAGFVMNFYAKGNAVTRVRCRCIRHNYKKYDEKVFSRQMTPRSASGAI